MEAAPHTIPMYQWGTVSISLSRMVTTTVVRVTALDRPVDAVPEIMVPGIMVRVITARVIMALINTLRARPHILIDQRGLPARCLQSQRGRAAEIRADTVIGETVIR
jgi:hypothetical protein